MAKENPTNPKNQADEGNKMASDETEKKTDRRRKQVVKKKSKNVLTCIVFSLDGTELTIEVEKNAPGEVLFSKVVENLDIVDKEYFGLRHMNAKSSSKCWLNLHKSIKKQFGTGPLEFQFAVKFYEPEPGRHLEEYTRYLLYLQLREDIVYGRLHCPTRTYVLLGSFTAQAEFGDYDPVDHGHTYLDDYQLGPEEIENEPKFLQRVIDLHREHREKTPAESEMNFLEVAKRTPRYGIDIHFVKDKKGDAIEVGVSHKGIILFKDGDAYDSFGWRAIDIVSYKRKKFFLKLFRSEKRKNPRFTLATKRDAKNLYKSAIEHHSFFRLTNPDPAKRRAEMFIIGSKFRYSDRTLYQIRSSPSAHEKKTGGSFARSPSKRQKSLKHRPTKRRADLEPTAKEPEKEEPGVEYEEIEIDESQPDDVTYNTEEWEIIEKVLPDGSKKKYRRRIITTTTTTTKTYVIRKGTEEIGHVLEDKPIVVSPVQEETETVEEKRVSPAEEKEHAERSDEHHHEEIVTTTIITTEIVTQPDKKVEESTEEVTVQGPMSLAEIRAASKKPSAAVKPLMREDLESEQTTTTTTANKVLVYDVDKEETVKIVSQEEREKELRQREMEQLELRKKEEQRLREEREEILRKQREEEERLRREQEEFERRQLELQKEEERRRLENMSPQFEEVTLATGNAEFDKEFGIMPDTFLIKTSPMPPKILAEIDDEVDYKDEKKDEDSLDNLVVEDTRKTKTLDRKFVRRPPPERSSGFIRRSYGDELDFDYSPGQGARTMPRKMKKYVPLITKEELVRAYSSGGLHDDSVIRSQKEEEEAEKSEIEYSLKNTSGVEQGESGFVKSLIGRHETIRKEKDEEVEERRRSRVYSSHEDDRGVVPTRSATFSNVEKPEIKKTKAPPPVKTKPVVFHPNTSGQVATPEVKPPSNMETALQSADGTDRSQPQKSEENKTFKIPEIVTTSVVYDEQAVPTGQPFAEGEPGIVPTKNISVVPAEASEPIQPPPPDVITHSDTTITTATEANESYPSEGFPSPPPDIVTQTILTPHPTSATYIESKEVVSTRMLPPEVQTHTVVISGDNMTKEEIDRLMMEGLVSTSETTVTKTSVMTTQQRIEKTIVTDQNTVVTEDVKIIEETH